MQIYITKHFTFASLSFMTFYINGKQEYRIWKLNLIENQTGPIPVTDVGRLKTGFQDPRHNSSLRPSRTTDITGDFTAVRRSGFFKPDLPAIRKISSSF